MERRTNSIDLADRHTIVTGGSQGIGFSVAKRLMASGSSVTIWKAGIDAGWV
jgi:2-dehydro-3-deoxy-L-rhamnonate dehydrogenase (NAD+)